MNNNNFQADIWQKLINFEKEQSFFSPKIGILVGFSGGADSVVLLHFIKQLSIKKQFPVYACHIHHGLRENADRDADFTKQTAKQLGVPFLLKKVKVKTLAAKENLSIEHAARKARYQALKEAAEKFNCKKIALAHHLDDNAETFLLNILRGTKAKGLLGIPMQRPFGKLQIIRPLMCITRTEVEKYIKEHNLSFITDETNFEQIFTRNWIRGTLLPLLEEKQPQIRKHINDITQDLYNYIKPKEK